MWVFGGIDRDTKEVFLCQVQDRSAETLIPLIQQHVRPGTTIISDEWSAYNALGEFGYHNLSVYHSVNFVDLTTGAHTENVEGTWSYCKTKLKRMRGTSCEMIGSYLVEFMWRRKYATSGAATFRNILAHIGDLFE